MNQIPRAKTKTPVSDNGGTHKLKSSLIQANMAEVNTARDIKNTKLQIDSSIRRFEAALSILVESLGKFAPDPRHAQEILAADEELNESIEQLSRHYEAGQKIRKLTEMSQKLDGVLSEALLGLAESRKKLLSEPGIESRKNDTPISAEYLLRYATRITKFTHAPPGYNPNVPNEHANFPWPSEDELRRGVLTLCAMGESQDRERYQTNDQSALSTVNNHDFATNDNISDIGGKIEGNITDGVHLTKGRSNSMVSYGERPSLGAASEPSGGPAVLDLDLFDPDAEDDEDDS